LFGITVPSPEKIILAVEASNISKHFGGFYVFKNLTLRLEASKIHGLVGVSSCGKSTLLKVLATIYPPDSGQLKLLGQEVDFNNLSLLRLLRSKIGFQFQGLALFDFLNVYDNVGFPLMMKTSNIAPQEVDARVMAILEAVGLKDYANAPLTALSGGMQRRVAVARAMVASPEICFLDEPTSGLDPVTSARIFELIARWHAETSATMVIASQDVDGLRRICDIVHIMANKTIVFSGSVADAQRTDLSEAKAFLSGIPQ
jgi:phospholipid/cholesterol/gamma-HCH transport system ATP-binding protein